MTHHHLAYAGNFLSENTNAIKKITGALLDPSKEIDVV
jgi:hypothetical protein